MLSVRLLRIEGQAGHDLGAMFQAPDPKMPAKPLKPVPHPLQAKALGNGFAGRGRHAPAVILNAEYDHITMFNQRHADQAGVRMAMDIHQRFLGDA